MFEIFCSFPSNATPAGQYLPVGAGGPLMVSIDEIIGEKDLVRLFETIVKKGEIALPNKQRVIRRIREFGPLSVEDLEGLWDSDVLAELEGCRRWSVLKKVRGDGR
uniref:Uncharacterized protein n=1 Tax=Encephalitozoon cuniculi TaxID=6035 RepID=M1KKW1_ENCCN|nr:hypothetical protein ECU07_1240 [Encephalitozoon cuniculi]